MRRLSPPAAVLVFLSLLMAAGFGCRREAEEAAVPQPVAERQDGDQAVAPPSKPVTLPPEMDHATRKLPEPVPGTPLVENPAGLKKMSQEHPLWIDPRQKKVVMVGAVCQRDGPLELFACTRNTKEYESVVVVNVPAHLVQAALLADGAEAGHPAKFGEQFVPPRGTVVEVNLIWKDEKGQTRRAPAQSWIRRSGTDQAMEESWVFAGGQFFRPQEGGKEVFAANLSGNLICVSNFPDAVLDVPFRSTESDAARLYEAFTERIPHRGTEVTILLEPKIPTPEQGRPSKEP